MANQSIGYGSQAKMVGRPSYLHIPGQGKPRLTDRTELTQAFKRVVKTTPAAPKKTGGK